MTTPARTEAYATPADMELALGRPLSETEAGRAPWLLLSASDLVDAYTAMAPAGFPEPYPGPVVRVTANAASRMVVLPPEALGVQAETSGGIQRSFTPAASSGGLWLSNTDKTMLSPYTKGDMVSVALTTERGGAWDYLDYLDDE